MDAYDWSTGVYATAVAMAHCMTTEELSRTAILLTQLGTTLGTLAALRPPLRQSRSRHEFPERNGYRYGENFWDRRRARGREH